MVTRFLASSMRLASSTSPSRVSKDTVPILRRYMRTGSVLRRRSSSSLGSGRGRREVMRRGLTGRGSGADSTVIPSSTSNARQKHRSRGSTTLGGRASRSSAVVTRPCALPRATSCLRTFSRSMVP